MDKLVRKALQGAIPISLFLLATALGIAALIATPREEEPQIVVPMVDVLVEAPGFSASQIARQVTTPLEKLLAQIPGVEHVYSTSSKNKAAVTLRFFVGENREQAILNTYNKLYANQHLVPQVVSQWRVNPVEVDDVPIVVLGLYSSNAQKYDDFQLRRVAEEAAIYLQGIENSSQVQVVGGRSRVVQILFNPQQLAARQSTASDIASALQRSNKLQAAGVISLGNQSFLLESGSYLETLIELQNTVVNMVDGQPVYLQDVAKVVDGPDQTEHYTWLQFAKNPNQDLPMVAISIAKKRGSNAVAVAQDVHTLVKRLQQNILPKEIGVEVLRDYGATANEKVNNLGSSLLFAVFTVVVFISIFLGWRHGIVVGLAVPVSYGITLALDMAFGYTINRVTLFALILSLGLLVDDPITGVDNIERFLQKQKGSIKDKIVAAMAEIKSPLMLSTLTIILAFVPLAFISGMMGPYMAPMAFNVPVSVISSTLVAFLVTPWLASIFLKHKATEPAPSPVKVSGFMRFYQKTLQYFLGKPKRAKLLLWAVLLLFVLAALLPVLRLVPLKLLPFDNKNELQLVVDMPESSSLEATAAKAKTLSNEILRFSEVQSVAAFVGVPSPIDFNGMVRHYYQRQAPYMAELRIQLIDKTKREHQSHAVALRIRKMLQQHIGENQQLKLVEVPPGPPVLSTLVAEVYGDELSSYSQLQQAALQLQKRLQQEAEVYDVDAGIEHGQKQLRFVVDKTKAALSGVATEDVNQLLQMANQGKVLGFMPDGREAKPLALKLRLAEADKSQAEDLLQMQVKGQPGAVQQKTEQGLTQAPQPLVALAEIGQFETQAVENSIQRKDLRPVVYVMAELSGRTPAEVIADVVADKGSANTTQKAWQERSFLNNGAGLPWQTPENIEISWTGEGEWKITVDVFRDMGLAFMFALVAIFFVLRWQTGAASLTLIIMSSIPLTIIGIMPGFYWLNTIGQREIAGMPEPVLFTATAMIGMIALAGIVVRNSLILVEFINQARSEGMAIKQAAIEAGMVRMRPVLLTAGTTLLGNIVIMLDPVFSGLALAIMFGLVASTLFTLVIVPVVYWLVFDKNKEGAA